MQELLIGFTSVAWQDAVMFAVGLALIRLAIKKEYEPMLLLPIGFGAPINAPLVGALMFGNLVRESGVLERLSKAT
jgi:Na+-transporting methylmalonyl-CoA/oxaloacetate decarboxylase beta subunit